MKHRLTTILIAVAVLFSASVSGYAQDSIPTLRPVTSSYMLEMGKAHLADTYLTPLHYRGSHWGYQYERLQAMRFNPSQWVQQLRIGAVLDHTKNPAKNATMANLSLEASWDMMYRLSMPHGLMVTLGGGPSLEAGVLYLNRNSNNPASAKAAITLDATASVSWSHRIGKTPFTLRYQPTMPLFGTFFSPDYGELYYQIYLGDRDGLLHAAYPGNYFKLDNLLTADLHFGNTSLRIGYHNRILSSKVNDLVTQNISHAIVLGITTEWISIKPNSKAVNAKVISATAPYTH